MQIRTVADAMAQLFFKLVDADYYYNVVYTGGDKGKASDCIKCGKCEKACPQHLYIRDLLADVAKEFEKK